MCRRTPAVRVAVHRREDRVRGPGQPPRVERREVGRLDAELGGAGPGEIGGEGGREEGARRALRDGSAEEPGRPGHREQRRDAPAAGRLAEDGDPVGVAAERADVVAHPLQRCDQVEEPTVGGPALDVAEPFQPDPVVEGHEDDTAPGERGAVVLRQAGRPEEIGPALDPHEDGQPAAEIGGPDVDGQPVVAAVGRVDRAEGSGLRRGRPEPGRLPRPVPPGDRRRSAEPDRCGIRDAPEHGQPGLVGTADDTAGDADVELPLRIHPVIIAAPPRVAPPGLSRVVTGGPALRPGSR